MKQPACTSSHYARVPGVVYACLNEVGEVIYVGCTCRLADRLRFHRKQTAWWPEVAGVRVSRTYPLRWQAMCAERATIVALQPRHNRMRDYVNFDPEDEAVFVEAVAA